MDQTLTSGTGVLGRVFSSTAASYKFFWLLALLELAPEGDRFRVRDVLSEMVAAAWIPAALYRLSFGAHDRLQNLVADLGAGMRIAPNASKARVKYALANWPEADRRLDPLARYVPSRFLAPWLAQGLQPSLRDDKRTQALTLRSQERRGDPRAGPYVIIGAGPALEVVLEPTWRVWLQDNLIVVRNFAELELARFLQARNPHVPGVVDKVRPTGLRNLARSRAWFDQLRDRAGLCDVYTAEPLAGTYAVDHFLPRAFVAHDLLWNLAPAAVETNRAKADQLPHPSFLPRLAELHFRLLQFAPPDHRDLEDYAAALGADVPTLRAASAESFAERHTQLISPLLQIAANQGFRQGWRPTVAELACRRRPRGARQGRGLIEEA